MKKFYDKHFKVNDDELISNSTFVANMVFSMFVMVICIAMMSMSAFAYFSYSLSSSHNTIVSASYSLSVVNKQGVLEEKDDPGVFILDNSRNTIDAVYSFEVKKMGTASVGFAQVIVINGDGEKIFDEYTSPIGDDIAKVRYFDITVPYGTFYTVKVIAHWGTCSTSAGDFDEIVVEITGDVYANERFDTIEVILEESDEEVDENGEILEGEEGTEEEGSTEDEVVGDDSNETDTPEDDGNDEIIGDDSSDTGSDDVLDDVGSDNDDTSNDNQDDSVLDDENGSDDEILDDGTDDELDNSDDQQTDEGSNDEPSSDESEENQEESIDNTVEQQDVENTEENNEEQEL